LRERRFVKEKSLAVEVEGEREKETPKKREQETGRKRGGTIMTQ